MSALSRRARDALGRLASTSSDASTRAFSRAIYPARASRDVLRASARRRDARQAVRQGQATAATAARPTRSGRAGRAGTRADARVESGRVAAREASWLEVFKTREARDEIGARSWRGGGSEGARADSSGETRVGDDSSMETRGWRSGAGDGAATRRWVVVGRVDAPGV